MWQANIIVEPCYKAVNILINKNPKLKQIITEDIKNEVHSLL
ncbi:MAG: hypothetical protein AB8U16_00240 [Rickettsiales endosymbiont of Dermacentor nuttalli]